MYRVKWPSSVKHYQTFSLIGKEDKKADEENKVQRPMVREQSAH